MKLGPFDLMAMVKKIRNGKVLANTPIYIEEEAEPVPAMQIEALQEFLQEADPAIASTPTPAASPAPSPAANNSGTIKLSVGGLFRSGLKFLEENQSITVVTGGFLLVAISINMGLSLIVPGILFSVLAATVSCYCFIFYFILILRKTRYQQITGDFFDEMLRSNAVRAAGLALVLALLPFILPLILMEVLHPAAIVLALFPGMFFFVMLMYAPLIMSDHEHYTPMQSIGRSRAFIYRLGTENMGVLFSLWMINFLGMFLFLPLFITLPVTISAMAEVYDAHYNE